MSEKSGGTFIALEGQDGVGKATQLKLLQERLAREGFTNTRTISLPQYDRPSSCFVKAYLRGDYGAPIQVDPYIASVFYAIDRYDANFKVRQWLADGEIVIADRWTMSNAAHQGAKIYMKTDAWPPVEHFLKWLAGYENGLLRIAKPFYAFLRSPSNISVRLKDLQHSRAGTMRDEHETNLDYQKAVAAFYGCLSGYYSGEVAVVQCCRSDDNSVQLLDPRAIHQRVWEVVKGRIY